MIVYQSRSRAAHWDGLNHFGEKVAMGVYFYTFKAGDFSATRKMLIRKVNLNCIVESVFCARPSSI